MKTGNYHAFFREKYLTKNSSDYFVKNYENINKIKLGIILDQVGYGEADSLMLYERYGSFQQLPLETQVLLNACLEVTGDANISFDSDHAEKNGLAAFARHIIKMGFATGNTDSNPFFEKRIPAFGVKAINASDMTEAVVHSTEDTFDKLSIETLRMSGNFVKTLTGKLEADQSVINHISDEHIYLLAGNKYLPASNLILCGFVFIAFIGGLAVYAVCQIIKYGKREDALSCFGVCVLSLVFASMLCFMIRFGLNTCLKHIPILVLFIFWIILMIAGLILIKRSFLKKGADPGITSLFQHIVLGAVFVASISLSNFSYAAGMIFLSLFTVLLVQFIGPRFKKTGYVIQGIWTLVHVVYTVGVFNVFLRGVSVERFMLLQTVNVFLFFTMNLNVWNRNKYFNGIGGGDR